MHQGMSGTTPKGHKKRTGIPIGPSETGKCRWRDDAKRATDALSTGRKRALKGGLSIEWMKDLYVKDEA